jgi:Domain of Unknown Function (DUF1521)
MTLSAINNVYTPAIVTDQFANDDVAGNGLIRDIQRADLIDLSGSAATEIPSIASIELSILPKSGTTNVKPAIKIPAAEFLNARLDLGEGYCLTVDERNQNLMLENTQLDARTLIWGDARIEGNTVSEPLQFWGTTSFVFGKESKITLETSQSPNDNVAYRLDKISVSTADRGIVITGLANDIAGDLQVADSKNGSIVDDAARDGFTLTESIPKTNKTTSSNIGAEIAKESGQDPAQKAQWLDDDDLAVTQASMAATAVGGLFGPGSTIMSKMEFGVVISRFFSAWALSSIMLQHNSIMSSEYNNRANDRCSDEHKASERRLIERLIVEQALIQDMQIERSIELYA